MNNKIEKLGFEYDVDSVELNYCTTSDCEGTIRLDIYEKDDKDNFVSVIVPFMAQVDCDYEEESDGGIGSYECFGFRGYDRGSSYTRAIGGGIYNAMSILGNLDKACFDTWEPENPTISSAAKQLRVTKKQLKEFMQAILDDEENINYALKRADVSQDIQNYIDR